MRYPVGDLREKLLKAGLVSQEQAQASVEAEQNRQSGERGGRQGQRGDQGGRGGGGPRQDARSERGGQGGPGGRGGGGGGRGPRGGGEPRAPRTDDANTPRLSGEEVKRLVELAQKGRIEARVRGQRRWYYVSRRHGLVPYLELSEEAAQNLESGTWALCETPRGESWLVTAETAKALSAADPTWIR